MKEYGNIYINTHQEVYKRQVKKSNSVIFFIHCMFGSPKYFNDYVELVPEDWAIHSVLLKGHGGTAREYGRANMREWKQQVNEEFGKLAAEYDNIYILSHSLGTLFSITLANAYPDKVKGMFLLSAPTRPVLTRRMIKTGFKLLLFQNTPGDIVAEMAAEKYSIKVSRNIFLYWGYLHNYVTLFQEIFEVRKHTNEITVPCWVAFSKYDELVRLEAKEYFEDVESAKVIILENSYHFYYEENDYRYLLEEFVAFCNEVREK